jgi:hypothetical protein
MEKTESELDALGWLLEELRQRIILREKELLGRDEDWRTLTQAHKLAEARFNQLVLESWKA